MTTCVDLKHLSQFVTNTVDMMMIPNITYHHVSSLQFVVYCRRSGAQLESMLWQQQVFCNIAIASIKSVLALHHSCDRGGESKLKTLSHGHWQTQYQDWSFSYIFRRFIPSWGDI